MGWENGGRYYTRSKREGGKVVRQYVGAGEYAAICARNDALRREIQADEQAQRRQVQAEDTQALAWLWWYCGAVERILRPLGACGRTLQRSILLERLVILFHLPPFWD